MPSQQPQPPKQPQRPKSKSQSNADRSFQNQEEKKPKKPQKQPLQLPPPSPWLVPSINNPSSNASFVEYLRWMRSPDSSNNDTNKRDNDAKLQLLQLALQDADYEKRLKQLTERTRRIVQAKGGCEFQVTCPWRIRVGGHRGPESMLLPAFDALGMPYIPSSTLRGIARTEALRAIKQQFLSKIKEKNPEISDQDAEKRAERKAQLRVARYFGALEVENPNDRTAKAIFLDAYPLPQEESKLGGLELDIANNIWSWDDENLKYVPNPNLFFSLKEPTFQIGILPRDKNTASDCEKIVNWLLGGLKNGAGSQLNSGYGQLICLKNKTLKAVQRKLQLPDEFFRIEFAIWGQQIHSYQKLNNPEQPYKEKDGKLERNKNGQLKLNSQAEPEIRPIAFKSMLRYWFRVLALGFWSVDVVKTWEARLFGAIQPQKSYGWVKVHAIELPEDGKNEEEQAGRLMLAFSPEAPREANRQQSIKKLFRNLLWLMSFLGGVGQGARRPTYERNSNPYIRGTNLYLLSESKESQDQSFWLVPSTIKRCQTVLRERLQGFYQAFEQLINDSGGDSRIEIESPRTVEEVGTHYWVEAVDSRCQILVVSGEGRNSKPYALKVLHDYFHELKEQGCDTEAKSLCGGTEKDSYKLGERRIERDVIPSPIWIADYEYYQVVTIFGATHNPRQEYIQRLRDETSNDKVLKIWPLQ